MSYLSTAIKKARYLITRDTDQVLILEKNDGAFVDLVMDTAEGRDAAIATAINNLLDGVPDALNTLNELATAIGDDANFAASVTTALGNRLQKSLNLSDLPSASAARTNLGLGSAALHVDTDFDSPTARDAAINAAVTNLLNGVPDALNTLNKLATAIGDDSNFAATIATALGNRLLWAGVWVAATNYHRNDLVVFNGGLYVAPADFTSGSTFDKTNWTELFPQAGTFVSRVTGLDITGATDMRTLIQAALNAAPSGSVVRLPGTGPTGKLIISSPGVVVPSNVDFQGEGLNATVLQAKDGATAFNLVSFAPDAVNSRVRHMRMQGNPTNPQQALQWQRNNDCLVQFCSFDANWTTVSLNTAIGGGGYGANIKCVNCGVTDCKFDGNVIGNGAIVDWVDSTSCYTERNHCVNSQGQGTWLTQAQTAGFAIANRIKDNVVEICHTGVGNISAQDTEIDGNTFLFGYSSAINTPASGPQESSGLKVTNNTCIKCGVGGGPVSSVATAAILIEANTPGAVVTGNTCVGSGKAGITVQSPDSIVEGNTCLFNGEEGISGSAGSDGSMVNGNACRNNSQNGSSHGGINISSTDCVVMGNTCTDDQAPASPIVLSGALSTAGAITSLPVNALAVAVASGQWINLVSGTHTQTVQATAPAAIGATAIAVASFTPNFAYPTSSTLTYGTQGALVHLGTTAANTTLIGNKGVPGVGTTYISDGSSGPTIRIANDDSATTARNRYAGDTAPFWKNFAAVGDTQPRAQLDHTQLALGPGGSTALDTVLTRSAAGVWLAQKALAVAGLTGIPGRFVGATVTGPPTDVSVQWLKDDFAIASDGFVWICTADSTLGTNAGTWVNPNSATPPAVGANIVAELLAEVDLVGNVITTTPTTLGLSYSAPAMAVGTLYRIVLCGDMDNKATSGTFQFALKIGSQQLGQYTIASQGSAKTNQPWRITAEVMCQVTGSGTAGKVLGAFQSRTSTDGASGITDPTQVNVDTTIANTIDILMTMSDAGSASNIVRAKYGYIEKAKA